MEIFPKKNPASPAVRPRLVISSYDDLDNPAYGGGGAVAVHEVARRLAEDFDVTVLTGKYPGSRNKKVGRVYYQRIGTTLLGARLGQLVFQLLLPFYARAKQYDLWMESFTPPFSTAFLPWFAGRPVVGLVHSLAGREAALKYGLPFAWLEQKGLRQYEDFIAVSEPLKQKILLANPGARVLVIPNGVEMPPRQEVREEKRHILYIGRVDVWQKGLDVLLAAYRQNEEKLSWPLVIAGRGTPAEEAKLKSLAARLGLDGRVVLAGRVQGEQKNLLFRQALFAVVPSRTESFSLFALECLAFGVPLLAFDIEGLGWLPPQAALKIPTYKAESLGRGMRQLAGSRELRTSLAKQGRKAARLLTWDKAAERYKQHLLSLAEDRPSLKQLSDELLGRIAAEKLPCYFISPHLDDALLSAGSLIARLAEKTEVRVVTVFTEGDSGPQTFSARKFLRICGFSDAMQLYEERRLEDAKACRSIKAKPVHLGFIDAAWRKKAKPKILARWLGRILPEFLHLYPLFRWHVVSGKLHKQDEPLKQEIIKKLDRIIPAGQPAAVFGPAGFGRHVDHVAVRQAVDELFPRAALWQDQPYAWAGKEPAQAIPCRQAVVWPGNREQKQRSLELYRTQFAGLFSGQALPGGEEVFYLPENFMAAKDVPSLPVSVLISAHNEEANIRSLLAQVLAQRQENFKLLEILLVSDGSDDQTVPLAESLADPRIHVFHDGARKGKSSRLNELFALARGQVCIMLDADVLLNSPLAFRNVVEPFLGEPGLGLVSGLGKPWADSSVISQGVLASWRAFDRMRLSWRGGDNVYSVNGCFLAARREFLRSVAIPPGVFADDQYLYFACKKYGYGFRQERSAQAWFKVPANLKDHLKQNTRFIANHLAVREYFQDLAAEEYGLPTGLLLKAQLAEFFKKPLPSLVIFMLNRYCRYAAARQYRVLPPQWEAAASTKEGFGTINQNSL